MIRDTERREENNDTHVTTPSNADRLHPKTNPQYRSIGRPDELQGVLNVLMVVGQCVGWMRWKGRLQGAGELTLGLVGFPGPGERMIQSTCSMTD